jgi:Flp pilus assembly secretin CpaC
LIAIIASLTLTGLASAHPYRVPADHAGLIRLPDEAAALIIGNPEIADATLFDTKTILVTGKVFGRTNIIALNASGQIIYTADLTVTQNDRAMVQVFHNINQSSLICDPVCQTMTLIGGDSPGSQAPAAGSGG